MKVLTFAFVLAALAASLSLYMSSEEQNRIIIVASDSFRPMGHKPISPEDAQALPLNNVATPMGSGPDPNCPLYGVVCYEQAIEQVEKDTGHYTTFVVSIDESGKPDPCSKGPCTMNIGVH